MTTPNADTLAESGPRLNPFHIPPDACDASSTPFRQLNADRDLSHRRPDDARDQVRLRIVVLADRTVGARSGRVEVAQSGVAPAIRGGVIGQGPLDRELGVAVGVDRLLARLLGELPLLGDAIG